MVSDSEDPGPNGTRRRLAASVAGLAIVAPFVRGRRLTEEAPIALRYTSHVPRSHGLYTQAFVPFSALVEEQTEGRLRFEAFTDRLLHSAADGFKAAMSGITDYTHAYVTYQPGSFKLLHAPQLPFLFSRPQVATLAFEELYPRYFKEEFERMGVYLAHCDCTSPYNILSKTPLRRLEDMRGIKIRVTGGLTADIYRELGAVPVAISAAEIYPAFQRGVVDAVAFSPADMASYRLQEVGSFYTRVDLNMILLQYCLNRRAFDGLPGDLRERLYGLMRIRSQIAAQSYYSGPGYARALRAIEDGGVEMIELDQAERERWRAAVAPLKERYIARYEALDLPAGALVAAMEELAAEYAALGNETLMARVMHAPTAGIIDL